MRLVIGGWATEHESAEARMEREAAGGSIPPGRGSIAPTEDLRRGGTVVGPVVGLPQQFDVMKSLLIIQ